MSTGNYPPDMSQRDWSHVNGEDDGAEEVEPSCDDGGYCRGDEG